MLHEHTPLKVTSASVTSSKHPRCQENKLCSSSSSLPQTPANQSPLDRSSTISPHIFLLKHCEIKSLSKLHWFRLPNNVWDRCLAQDGSEERKTKDVKGFLLKCKRLSAFSFISHFRTVDRLHSCQEDIHRIPGLPEKHAHCQQVTFSF